MAARAEAESASQTTDVPVDPCAEGDVTLRLREGSFLAREIRRLIRETRAQTAVRGPARSEVRLTARGSAAARREARELAALWFDRGWTALRKGASSEALSAWETACLLEPDNRVYALDLHRLQEKLGRRP